jgi:hypothetical protein
VPWNKGDEALWDRVLRLVQKRYADVNDRHLQELLERKHSISIHPEASRRHLRKATEEAERTVCEKQQKLTWQVKELQRRLAEAMTNKERAIAQAQLTRSGHVYVISNVGSFGEQVYKIGMTWRLNSMDRVNELVDVSISFPFDVHTIIYSEDGPSTEVVSTNPPATYAHACSDI